MKNNQHFFTGKSGYPGVLSGAVSFIHLTPQDHRFQIWRWWSYQFTHTGVSHVGTFLGPWGKGHPKNVGGIHSCFHQTSYEIRS